MGIAAYLLKLSLDICTIALSAQFIGYSQPTSKEGERDSLLIRRSGKECAALFHPPRLWKYTHRRLRKRVRLEGREVLEAFSVEVTAKLCSEG